MSEDNQLPLLGDDVVITTSASSFSDQEEEEGKVMKSPMSPSQLSRQSTAILLGKERKNTPKFLFMRGLSTDHPRSLRLKKFFGAVFTVSNAAIGSGILAFPYAYACAGFALALGITLIAITVNAFTLITILRTARRFNVGTYQEVVRLMFGEKYRRMLIWMSVMFCFLVNVSYMLVISSMISSFFKSFSVDLLSNILFLMGTAWLILQPLCFVRSVSVLGKTSVIGVCAVLFTTGVLVYHGSPSTTEGAPHSALDAVNFKPKAFQAIPLIMFSLMCHLTVTPATGNLVEYWPSLNSEGRVRMRTLVVVVCFVMTLCFTLYSLVGFFGYILFGPNVESDILDSFGTKIYFNSDNTGEYEIVEPSTDVKIARLCMATTTGFGYPVMVYVARTAIFDIIGEKQYMSRDFVKVTLTYTVSALGAAMLCHILGLDLGFVMSIVGCTAGAMIQLIIPSFLLIKSGDIVKGRCLLLIGSFVVVVGLFVTLSSAACSSNSISDSNFCNSMGM